MNSQCRILLAEDNEPLRRAILQVLLREGFSVQQASDGTEALDAFRQQRIDVVLTDLVMPRLDGMGLLEAIRELNPHVPVVILTGHPTLQTAEAAVRLGAFRYIEKPFAPQDLKRVVYDAVATRSTQATPVERNVPEPGLAARFEAAFHMIWVAYQPIVHWPSREVLGYEALLRTNDDVFRKPIELLQAAHLLGEVRRLSRAVRRIAPEPMTRTDALLFVNLVPEDLEDDELFAVGTPLAQHASDTVLELTERARIEEVPNVRQRVAELRERGFRFAVDDLGCGYSGLNSIALVEPEFIKLDMELIRGVDGSRAKLEIVRSMLAIGTRLGTTTIAEGVETEAELRTLLMLGCECFQGFLFARPGTAFPEPNWPLSTQAACGPSSGGSASTGWSRRTSA